jgi:hypothetical protein
MSLALDERDARPVLFSQLVRGATPGRAAAQYDDVRQAAHAPPRLVLISMLRRVSLTFFLRFPGVGNITSPE